MEGLPGHEDIPDRHDIAPFVELVRSGVFAAAMDMNQILSRAEVPNGAAALLSGTIEAAVQMWVQVMLKSGNTNQKIEDALNQQVQTYFRKHIKRR